MPAGSHDLLTMCMAFHWFERSEIVSILKNTSKPKAIWLIYNFWLAGHASNEEVNAWLSGWYRTRYPSPPRRDSTFIPTGSERDVELLTSEVGEIGISFNRRSLIGYLTTQSNVEACVRSGSTYAEIEREIEATLPAIEAGSGFRYGYSFSISRFAGA